MQAPARLTPGERPYENPEDLEACCRAGLKNEIGMFESR
jgi:hypothetical protein